MVDVAGDPRTDSLCFRRPRAMVANRVETLGGDEASRFRTIPLSLMMEGVRVSAHVRDVWKRERAYSSGSALAMNVSTMRLL